MSYSFIRKKAKSVTRPFAVYLMAISIATLGLPGFIPVAMAVDTGFKIPTTASTNNGHNDWDTNTVANAQTSNDVYISDNDEGDEQGYEDFSFVIPADSTINGVEVIFEAKSTDTSGCQIETALSWNNGSNFTSMKTAALTGSDASYTFGGAADTWSHVWTNTQLNDNNFVARVSFDDVSSNSCQSSTVSVDELQVKVYYTEPVTPEPNPALPNSCGLDIALVMDSS